jgi:hypothetical protein
MSASTVWFVKLGFVLQSKFLFNPKHFKHLSRQMISVKSISDVVSLATRWKQYVILCMCYNVTPRPFKRFIVDFSKFKHILRVLPWDVRILSIVFLKTRRPPSIMSICKRNKLKRFSGACAIVLPSVFYQIVVTASSVKTKT